MQLPIYQYALKHLQRALQLSLLLLACNCMAWSADSIQLNDKTRLKGTIIDETDDTVIILVKDKRHEVKRDDIASMRRKKITYPPMPESPWTCLGPGGGGAMYVPTLSPIDPNLGMIACDMGGVYLTRDRGLNWTLLPTSQIGRYGHGLAFSPRNPRVMFAGTSHRLFRSSDAGASWAPVTANRKSPRCAVMDTLIDPDNPKLVWASFGKGHEAGHKMQGGNHLLIERSNDGGVKFSDASKGLPQGDGLVRQLAIDSNSPKNKRVLYAATSHGLYVSKDSGGSWSKTGKGINKDNIRQVSTMCDSESGKTIVLASAEPSGVFRSEDGENFQAVSGIPNNAIVEAMTSSNASATTAWACGASVWKTVDGGKTWIEPFDKAKKNVGWLSTFFPWVIKHTRGIGCDPLNPDRVWITGDMHLWSTTDGGASFTELNSRPLKSKRLSFRSTSELGRHGLVGKGPMHFTGGGLEVTFVYQICPDPNVKNRYYSCCADIGGFRSDDDGDSWSYNLGTWNKGIPSNWRNSCYEIAVHPKKRGLIWGAFTGRHNLPGTLHGSQHEVGGIAMSTNNGQSWIPFEKNGLPNKPATSICIDRRLKGKAPTLYAAIFGSGVFVSHNGGSKWEAMSAGLPKNPLTWRLRQGLDNTLYLICTHGKPGGIWRFDEKAKRWTRLDKNSQFKDVRDIIIAKDKSWEPGFLAIAVSGDNGGVYTSEDSGETWKQTFDQSVTSVDCTIDKKIWYTCGRGLWRGNKSGKWARLEFPFAQLNDVTIPTTDEETLWIGTAGGGIFKGPSGAK